MRISEKLIGSIEGEEMTRNRLSPPTFPHAWASEWGQDQYGLWQAFTYKNIRHAFRWIPPGTFTMGSPADEEERLNQEDLHQVTLTKGFGSVKLRSPKTCGKLLWMKIPAVLKVRSVR